MSDYIIRQARPEDLDSIIKINRENLPENYPPFFFKMHMEYYPRAFYVAEANGKIVGYVMCRVERGSLYTRFKPWGRQGHIISIAVSPEMRRKGIGTALMKASIKSLREVYNVDEIYLEVRVSNTPAISLYKKLGFNIVKTIKGYYRDSEDAYVMARPAEIRQ